MFSSRFMPCAECGASVEQAVAGWHACSPERRADYAAFGLRGEAAQLEDAVRRYLETASGRFECWLAARHVRGQV